MQMVLIPGIKKGQAQGLPFFYVKLGYDWRTQAIKL